MGEQGTSRYKIMAGWVTEWSDFSEKGLPLKVLPAAMDAMDHHTLTTWHAVTADCYTTLKPTTVDLWRIPLERPVQTDWLSEDELARFHRYRFERDQRKFAVARSSLRQILARYIDTPPNAIGFEYSDRGKPALQNNSQGLEFNLSHSGEYALCGIAQKALGIDIEQLRPMDRLEGLLQRCMAPSEQRAIAQVPTVEKSTAFLQYWTCKEAYLKAIGQGLSESLAAIEVTLDPTPKLRVPGPPWQLQTLVPCPGYTAALVIPCDITQIRCWTHES